MHCLSHDGVSTVVVWQVTLKYVEVLIGCTDTVIGAVFATVRTVMTVSPPRILIFGCIALVIFLYVANSVSDMQLQSPFFTACFAMANKEVVDVIKLISLVSANAILWDITCNDDKLSKQKPLVSKAIADQLESDKSKNDFILSK